MATLDKVDGFEHGNATSGVAGVYGGVSGSPATFTTPVRTGLRMLSLTPIGATEDIGYTGYANTIIATAFYLHIPTGGLPAATSKLFRFLNANGSGYLRVSSAGQLSIIAGAGSAVNVGSAISLDAYHRIVMEYDTSTGTATFRAKVDNGTEATATNAQASANITEAKIGTDAATTYTAYFDDWIISVIDADYEEIGGTWTEHRVESLIPNSDGTHSGFASGDFDSFTSTAFTTSTTNGNTFIAHRPLQLANTAEQVIRQDIAGTAAYMEFGNENMVDNTRPVAGVRTYASLIQSSNTGTSPKEARLLLADDTEVLTTGSISAIDAAADPGITLNLYKRMTIPPSGGWDGTKVDGLKWRIGFGDGAPDDNFIDLMVEVASYTAPAAEAVMSDRITTGRGFSNTIYPGPSVL